MNQSLRNILDFLMFKRLAGVVLLQSCFWLIVFILMIDLMLILLGHQGWFHAHGRFDALLFLVGMIIIFRGLIECQMLTFRTYEVTYTATMRLMGLPDREALFRHIHSEPFRSRSTLSMYRAWVKFQSHWWTPAALCLIFYISVGMICYDVWMSHIFPILKTDSVSKAPVLMSGSSPVTAVKMQFWWSTVYLQHFLPSSWNVGIQHVLSKSSNLKVVLTWFLVCFHILYMRVIIEQFCIRFKQLKLYECMAAHLKTNKPGYKALESLDI
jgi:hypothetical protein